MSPAEVITEGVEDWLLEEVESSRTGRNSVLDKHQPNLVDIRKVEGHYNRLTAWTEQFAKESANDYLTARQLFAAQMHLSGLFRMQCQILARSQEEYEKRRFGSYPLGINVSKHVNDILTERFGKFPVSSDLSQETVRLEQLVSATTELNDRNYSDLNKMSSYTRPRKAGTIIKLQRMQREWLNLSTDYILYAAQIRGGNLSTVPFLEPKSYSDSPQVYYPFEC